MSEGGGNGTLDPERMQGQEVSGCKITEKLATGGMGTVYRALQVSMNRQVAIKCLAEDFARDKQYVARFVREARAAGELSHTHLIHVLDVGVHQGVYYYIMEYVDGQSLDRILKIKKNLGPETVIEIMIQTARALSYAHSHEIIHRDIKPDNLMITSEGTVKLADLGIAKKMDPSKESTDAGLVLGTPNYMAPEQATDASLTDRRSDIYALGSTAYHMLSGQPPYTGKNALEILTNVIKKKPVPIEKLKPDLPKSMVSILNKMMARDPEQRYQTMTDLLKDLEAYKAGKFKPEKAAPAAWDDEDEDSARMPKVALEIAPTEEEVAAAARPAPGTESQESMKLSGTRVLEQGGKSGSKIMANPSLGSNELIAARAIGAISEKPKSKMIPILTLAGALGALGIGMWVVKKVSSQKTPEPVTGKRELTQVDIVETTDVPGEKEALEMLEEARKRERGGAMTRNAQIAMFVDVFDRYPETPSGKQAKVESERIEKEWVAAVEERVAEARKLLAAAGDKSYQPAIEAAKRARNEAQGRSELVKQVIAVEGEIESTVASKAQAILARARGFASKNNLEPAIAEALRIVPFEVPRHTEDAVKLVTEWARKLRADREEAMKQYLKTWSYACQLTRGDVEEFKGEIRFDKALERLENARKNAEFASIRSYIEFDLGLMKAAASVPEAAIAQIESMIGQPYLFTKETFPNQKAVKILEVNQGKVFVDYGGRKVQLKQIAHADVLLLADKNLQTEPGRCRLASYQFVKGETTQARARIQGFMGAESLALRARIDEQRIADRKRTRETRDLMSPNESAAWSSTQKGDWIFAGSGELIGSGMVGERLLLSPPELYELEFEARREAGVNGFVVYFTAWGSTFQWHVGDGGNVFSIVRGLPGTRTDDILLTGLPVLAKVVVIEDKAVGYLDGVRKWEIHKSQVGAPQPGPGLGLGVFNTAIRFRDIRLTDLTK